MASHHFRQSVLLVTAFGIVASSFAEDSFVGKWKAKEVRLPVTVRAADATRKVLMKSNLELRADHTFDILMGGPMKGTWEVKDNQLLLSFTEMGGYKMSEVLSMVQRNYANNPTPARKAALDELSHPLVMAVSADRKTLTTKSAPGKGIVTFIRQ